jgi:hypothetical protein
MKSMTAGVVLSVVLLAGCSKEAAPTAEEAAAGKEAPAAAAPQQKAPIAAKPAPPPRPAPIVIAEGTSLTVRTTSALSTKSASAGESFMATLEKPLTVGQRVVAPKGATVQGTVVNADDGGRVKGRAVISVRLTGLEAGGKNVAIDTNTITRQARATKAKDATKVGIGAGIGAAIGAIAGGGKGAAIGAATGAGAGTGVVLATKGEPAVIPSESVLIFELQSPATVE